MKEPIRKPWIWIVLVVLVLLSVPWYLPVGTYKPIVWGFPYWAFISLVLTIAIAGFVTWIVNREWDME